MALEARRIIVAIALMGLLFVSTAYVTNDLNAIPPSVPSIRLVRPVTSQFQEKYGTLSLDVLLGIKETFYGADSLPAYFKPIAGKKVAISLSNSPNTAAAVLTTNASGLIEAKLPVSNYYVATLHDARFHVAIPFSILQDTTTSVVLKVQRLASTVLFDEVYGASPVTNATANTIFLKVRPTTVFSNSSLPVFLEISDLGAKIYIDPNSNKSVAQEPVKILGQLEDGGGLWMRIQTEQGAASIVPSKLALITYVPIYTETFSTT